MDADQALQEIRRLAVAHRIVFTRHARTRMGERGATVEDVRSALASATSCRAADEGRWKVTGPDLDGDDLDVVAVVEADVVVVTVF